MGKFRRRPTIIEAEQFDGTNFCKGVLRDPGKDQQAYVVTIHRQRCYVVAGDYIIPEPDGEHYYPCKPDIFEATYEPIVNGKTQISVDDGGISPLGCNVGKDDSPTLSGMNAEVSNGGIDLHFYDTVDNQKAANQRFKDDLCRLLLGSTEDYMTFHEPLCHAHAAATNRLFALPNGYIFNETCVVRHGLRSANKTDEVADA